MFDQAACRDHEALFMAAIDRGCDTHINRDITARCKVICRRCPIRRKCLDWALGIVGEQHGVLGGLDADERAKLIEKQR
jgi:WhiB family redox-sensing transcriptional regulator